VTASVVGEEQCHPDEEVHSVKRLLILGVIGVAAVVAGIAIAATGTGGGAAKTDGVTVSAKRISGAGSVLVDAKGRALYRSDQERNGMVLCDGACLSFWQPLTVSGTPKGRSLSGKLGVVKRPDGRRQVTYNGKLLYSFKLDKPGKVTGDGFKDAFGGQKFTWRVAHPTATKGSSPSAGTPTTTSTPTTTYPGY
jgi:predicted lipoprotein with Yx(FWY)xxD motif